MCRVERKSGASGMDRSDMPLKRRKAKVPETVTRKRIKGIEWCPKVADAIIYTSSSGDDEGEPVYPCSTRP